MIPFSIHFVWFVGIDVSVYIYVDLYTHYNLIQNVINFKIFCAL